MEPKSGPRMHWSWPFSSTVAGTHPFWIPLIPWENVVSPQCPDCYISFLAGASLSPTPSPKVQLWFCYPCWKTPLARTVFQEVQFLGMSFKAFCSLASAVSPRYSPSSTLGHPWHWTCCHSMHMPHVVPPPYICLCSTPCQECPFLFYPTFFSFLATHTGSLRVTFSENCPWHPFLPQTFWPSSDLS